MSNKAAAISVLACVALGLTSTSQTTPRGGGPANDMPCDALPLEAGVPLDFDNTDATADPNEVTPGVGSGPSSCNSSDGWCESDPNAQVSVWFTFEASGAALTRFSAGPGDYQIAVWTADDSTNFETFVEVGANDDSGPGFSPRLSLLGLEAGTYYVQVDGWNGSAGPGTALVEEINPPENDDVCNATWLDLDTVTDFTNDLAGAQDGEVSPGVGNDGGNGCNATDGWCVFDPNVQASVWFMFEAPECGVVSIDVNSDVGQQDYQLAVWHVGDCNDFSTFTEVGANDDSGPQFSPSLSLELVAYELYYVQVDGFNGFDAPGQISLSTSTTTGSDCDGNGITDNCDIAALRQRDCNCNGIPDRCEINEDPSLDVWPRNGRLDECDDNCIQDNNCDGVIDGNDLWMNVNHLQNLGWIPPFPRHPNNNAWWLWLWSFMNGCTEDTVIPVLH